MSKENILHREQRLEDILFSDLDPIKKSQKIVKLGFDQEVADEIVDRHQIGTRGPVYYERLDFADIDDDIDTSELKIRD